MAVIVEDGTGSNPLANSYGDETGLQTYADARGTVIAGDLSQLLIRAMDYAETLDYKGSKVQPGVQPLQHPRSGLVIDGYTVPSDSIAIEMITAQYVTALSIDAGLDPLATVEPAVKREKVDVLEVEYQDGASSSSYNPEINRAYSKLVTGSGGGNQISVVRA